MKHDLGLLGLRLTVGGYLAVHGAQKLFGAFDGPGLEKVGAGFEHVGLRPGKTMAALAGGSEFVGGLLTAVGLANPVGPLAIAGAMTVATAVHLDNGPMGAKDGYEMAFADLAAATALASTGPGRYSVDQITGFRLPKGLLRLFVAGTVALTGYCTATVLRTRKEQRSALPAAVPAEALSSNGPSAPAEAATAT